MTKKTKYSVSILRRRSGCRLPWSPRVSAAAATTLLVLVVGFAMSEFAKSSKYSPVLVSVQGVEGRKSWKDGRIDGRDT